MKSFGDFCEANKSCKDCKLFIDIEPVPCDILYYLGIVNDGKININIDISEELKDGREEQ